MQALVLLNDPTYVEAARCFAASTLSARRLRFSSDSTGLSPGPFSSRSPLRAKILSEVYRTITRPTRWTKRPRRAGEHG